MRQTLFIISIFSLFLPASVLAQAAPRDVKASLESDYVVPYVGYFDITQDDDAAAQFGIDYRFAHLDFGFRPALGFNVSTDGSLYGYGGFFWDIDLWDGYLFLTPNFVAGLYEDGSGKDLGGPIEFRSGVELSYMLENTHRVGVSFNHISNAGIHDRNPGAETLLINYHVPFGELF